MTIKFERFSPADTAALIQLIGRIEAADEGLNRDQADIQAEIEASQAALVQAGWLVRLETGELAGYNYVDAVHEAEAIHFWLHGGVDSSWRGQGIGRELIRRSWTDMRQQRAAPARPAFVNAWAYEQDTARQRLFARLGLRPYHVYTELALPAAAVEPIPPLPAGILIRPWADRYCEAAASLRNQAFAASWGYQPTTGQALRRHFSSGRYEPAYSFTAWQTTPSGEVMVGLIHACLAWTRKQRQANEAEIVWLAVAPEVRSQGLGRLLMLTVMHTLRQAGVETFSVSADHPAGRPAIGLYTGLGFTVRKAIVDYQGEL